MSIYNWNQNNIMPESLVEVIWVCKVYDSCEQTLDSFNKFYIFNHGWLNESSIMMTPTNQHISKQETIFMWQIVLQSPFQGISTPSYASERTLNSSHGENARLSKIANTVHIEFLSGYICPVMVVFHYNGHRVRKFLVSWLFWVAF